MTLPFGKPTSIQNRQQDAESRKILFVRVNHFDQPIKTWDKTFLKLFLNKSARLRNKITNFKQYKTESTDKSQTQLTIFAIAFDSSHKEAKNL